MKKRILLGVLITLALVCLFAISISAVEVNGVHYTLNASAQTAEVSKDNKTATTEIVTIPSTIEYEGVEYRVTSIASSAFYGNRNMVELRILSEYITVIPADMIADICGKDTDGDKINDVGDKLEKVYIDFSKITSIGSAAFNPSNQTNGNSPKANSFYYYDAKAFLANGTDVLITCPDFSNCTSIGTAAFQGANFEKLVIHEDIALKNQIFRMSTIKELEIQGANRGTIEYYVFNSCKSLETIRIESTTYVSNDVFSGCSNVKEIYINLSNCTYIGSCAFQVGNLGYDKGNTITQWYNYEGERIVDLSSVKTLSNQAFASSNVGSAKIIWPSALESISSQVFRRCNITGPVWLNMAEGKTASISSYVLSGNTPEIIVLGNGITGFAMDERLGYAATVVFLGDVTTLATNIFKTEGARLYAKSLPNDASDYGTKVTVNLISSGSYTSYGACGLTASVTLLDGTTEKFNYVTHDYRGVVDKTVCPLGSLTLYTCVGCLDSYEKTEDNFVSKEHGFNLENGATVVEIIYASNNYFANGNIIIKCASCEATNSETEFGALFEAVGYSVNEISGGYISHTVKVNLENVKEYERLTGATVRYGLVAAMHKDGMPISLNDGEIITAEKSYSLEMTGTEYSNLLIKIHGITSDMALNCNAYAIINGEITYLCGDVASNTATAKSLGISPEIASSISIDAVAPEAKQYA